MAISLYTDTCGFAVSSFLLFLLFLCRNNGLVIIVFMGCFSTLTECLITVIYNLHGTNSA